MTRFELCKLSAAIVMFGACANLSAAGLVNPAMCTAPSSLGSVFSVLGDGVINITNDGEDSTCHTIFYGTSTVNAKNGNFQRSGTLAGIDPDKPCKAYQSVADEESGASSGISESGRSIPAYGLPEFQVSASQFDLSFPNESQFSYGNSAQVSGNANDQQRSYPLEANSRSLTLERVAVSGQVTYYIPGGDYDEITTANGVSIVFQAPVRIKKLSLNGCQAGDGVTFSKDADAVNDGDGETYIGTFDLQAQCSIKIAGDGKTTLNILGKNSDNQIVGWATPSKTCINYESCLPWESPKDWTSMDAQHPELLQINVYNGDFSLADSSHVAAGIYIPNGDGQFANGTPVTIVGEVLANNIYTQNNVGTRLFSKSTSQALLSSAPYTLVPLVTEDVVRAGSFVYRAMQSDYVNDDGRTPGVSGYLRAYALKADTSQEAQPSWDTSTTITLGVRGEKIFTDREAVAGSPFVSLSAISDPAFFGVGPFGAGSAQCIINPGCDGGKRLAGRAPGSLVGAPWRVQPILVGDSVIFATDDGIIYSVKKADGALNWGWMPSRLVPMAADPAQMMRKHPYGQLTSYVFDGKTYVLGTALGGQLHFSIEVNSAGTALVNIAWQDYREGKFSPGSETWGGVPGRPYGGAAPVQSTLAASSGKVAYMVGNQLVSRKVDGSDNAIVSTFSAPGNAVSAGNFVAPAVTTNLWFRTEEEVYFGTLDNKVWRVDLDGELQEAPGDLNIGGTAPMHYINGSRMATSAGNALMLVAQNVDRVTVLKSVGDVWSVGWYTGVGGASASSHNNAEYSIPASDNAYLSGPPIISNGELVLSYTTKPNACTFRAYAFGPLSLETGLPALEGLQYRLTGTTNSSHYIGAGEGTGGQAVTWEGSAGDSVPMTLVGGSGSGLSGEQPNSGGLSKARNSLVRRLNWRELTNFF